ncbi:tRNA-splicing ligase [Tubulinosema ratisbonensis]|uniref:3'-phosphate/5'-hydroxy nucleic acid ligase n=1 Tax=Tubulinosema ratisbonensis TaxID=291195 RepID=A0A437AIU6_9MICR|nr:tRNA-splicing ligase [Tubulinosema ratisbonensis]
MTFLRPEKIKLFLNENEKMPEDLVDQINNVSKYNCVNQIVILPDAHLGHFFPVGSVVSVDLSYENCLIFPSGIGYDINCGVRMVKTDLFYENVKDRLSELADKLFKIFQ